MKITTPVSRVEEVEPLMDAGAGEFYCGVVSAQWYEDFTNMASVNRVERKNASLSDYGDLARIVKLAHGGGRQVFLAFNGLYTSVQFDLLETQIEDSIASGVDALIVADMGLLLRLLELDVPVELHVSTGGTTFNAETARFYRELGADRVIIPRQLSLPEIARIVEGAGELDTETFVLNAGCRHITGMCTFQHGVDEVKHRQLWRVAEKFDLGNKFMNVLRHLPPAAVRELNLGAGIFGAIAPCMMNFDVSLRERPGRGPDPDGERFKERVSPAFYDLFYGIDTCGACALYDFRRMGVDSVKIVGRGFDTAKKVRDVTFIKGCIDHLFESDPGREAYEVFVRERYQEVYGLDCRELCYYARGKGV